MLRITYDGGKILDESLPHVDKKTCELVFTEVLNELERAV